MGTDITCSQKPKNNSFLFLKKTTILLQFYYNESDLFSKLYVTVYDSILTYLLLKSTYLLLVSFLFFCVFSLFVFFFFCKHPKKKKKVNKYPKKPKTNIKSAANQ